MTYYLVSASRSLSWKSCGVALQMRGGNRGWEKGRELPKATQSPLTSGPWTWAADHRKNVPDSGGLTIRSSGSSLPTPCWGKRVPPEMLNNKPPGPQGLRQAAGRGGCDI